MNNILMTFFLAIMVFPSISQTIKKEKNRKDKTEAIQQNGNSKPIVPKEYSTLLGIGIDVVWAESRKGIESFNPQMVKDFKASGLKHIRIRVKDYPDAKFLAHTDKVIQECLKNDLIPILAYHGGEFEKKPNMETLRQSVTWWKTVSEYFKHCTHKLSFDLIIEVTDALNKENELLNTFYEEATKEIRKTNPTRIIFISPRVRSQPENLKDLIVPTQHNNYLMAEWHFYASGPDKMNPLKKWTTGTEEEKNIIRTKIKLALDWSNRTGIYTWVGAWMAGNYNKGDNYTVDEQIVFAKFVSCELQRNKIPFAFNADHKYYSAEEKKWITKLKPVYDEIVNTECK